MSLLVSRKGLDMTIALSRRQVQDGLATSGALVQAEAIYAGVSEGTSHQAASRSARAFPPAIASETDETVLAVSLPLARATPRLMRRVLRVLYWAIRPIARPLAWRTRGFLQRNVLEQLSEIRASQTQLLIVLQQIEQRTGASAAAGDGVPAPHPVTRLRRRVHQFHAGSATGDAITNAMLLIQQRLRAQGYDSEIFVEHLAPGLENRLHPLSALPVHDDHVLIVHHSMGHDGFDRVLASPAPKVLIYHNITPPELLDFNPYLQRAAELGRRQLAVLRDHVVAALADSAFNGVELRKLGFACVREATLLFDIDRLKAQARSARQPDAPFTVLFVGREVPSKGQADLVEAFARFAGAFTVQTGRAARLVLAGAGASDAAAYRADIVRRIGRHGLAHSVFLTGALSNDALHGWFGAADLYVSLSRHEGFGVPLVEAMAYGIPVVALGVGAVPATLGGAGVLLADFDPETVAAAMLIVACDTVAAKAIVARQFKTIGRWRLAQHLPRLMEALHLAGAAPPKDCSAPAALREGLRLTLTHREQADTAIATLLAKAIPGRVRLCDTGIAVSHWAGACGPEISIALDARPPKAEVASDLCLALLLFPATVVPTSMVREINTCFDGVLVRSMGAQRAAIESGITVAVRVVGSCIALPASAPRPARTEATCFLHVSDGTRASGTDVLLAAWARAFSSNDPVRLLVSFSGMSSKTAREALTQELAVLRRDAPDIAAIALQATDWQEADVYVQPSRDDIDATNVAHALAAGMPVIVTGCGGHMAFLGKDTPSLRTVRYRMQKAVSSGHPHALSAEPDIEDLVQALREAHVAPRRIWPIPASLAELAPDRHAGRVIDAAVDILLTPKSSAPRVAWVSPWNVRCGIAQYSRHLLEAFDRSLGDLMVLSDQREGLAQTEALPGVRIKAAFQVGAACSVPELAAAIAAEDPDVLVIQHQAGVLSWEALADLLEHPALAPHPDSQVQSGRCVVVALHNCRDLLRSDAACRARVGAALDQCSRVLVHSVDDIGLLRDLGVVNTVWIPHGTTAGPAPRAPQVLLSGDAPVVGTTGFILPHKGLQRLITAIGLLLPTWPGLRLRLVTSRYPDPVSDLELAACEALVRSLRLEAHVEWHTEFAPNDLVLHRLSSCDLLVMPYAATLESSSGAVRQAIASGVPTLVSDLKLFDDLGDAVERLPGTSPEIIAARIDTMLRQPHARAALQKRGQAWLDQHDWSLIAERLQCMLHGLHVERLELARRRVPPLQEPRKSV